MPLTDSPLPRTALPALPMQGLTILVVEDSRFACDALRLLAHRSGARLRRAATLHDARRHLALYQPDVMIVDLGLPDGRGTDLIREVMLGNGPLPLVLGTSGEPAGRGAALAAGAQGFLDKPLPGLGAFQDAVLHHLTGRPAAARPPQQADAHVTADPLALSDDLARVADIVAARPGPAQRAWLAGFVGGIARCSGDDELARAARALHRGPEALGPLAGLIAARAAERPEPFAGR